MRIIDLFDNNLVRPITLILYNKSFYLLNTNDNDSSGGWQLPSTSKVQAFTKISNNQFLLKLGTGGLSTC